MSEDDSFSVFLTSVSSWSSFSNKTSDFWRSTSICKAVQKTQNSIGHIVRHRFDLRGEYSSAIPSVVGCSSCLDLMLSFGTWLEGLRIQVVV